MNLDQLLAINKAMKYPVAYIQEPPGTGKTSTIINTIMTAFFNERSVLFVSYNNHPIDGVYEKLSQLEYRGRRIPFPILSIGNQDKMKKATQHMYEMYMQVQNVQIFAGTLDRNKDSRIERAKQLSELLKKYETILDLRERKETIQCLLEDEERRKVSAQMLPFQIDLHERQLH
ncbi:MAG: AAA domain-containing protein [Clostridium sp.]|nr:AAA domain-containing protein [Clostridium sp.]